MNFSPASRFRKPSRTRSTESFTLVELLVSIAVLVILLGLLSNFFVLVNNAYVTSKSNINNFAKARTSLDIMALDYQLGVFRPDLPAFVSGANTFYTLRQSSSVLLDTPRSLICYQVVSTATNSYLQRAANDVPTLPFNASTMPAATNFLNMVNGVLKMQVSFITPTGQITTTYTTGVRAVGVDLATVDDATLTTLVATGKLSALCSDPALSVDAGQTPYQSWQNNFTHASTATHAIDYGQYPASIRSGVQFFERYVPIQ